MPSTMLMARSVPRPASAYLRFLGLFTLSLTVVRGWRFVVDCLTNRPVTAERPRLPLLLVFFDMLASPVVVAGGPMCSLHGSATALRPHQDKAESVEAQGKRNLQQPCAWLERFAGTWMEARRRIISCAGPSGIFVPPARYTSSVKARRRRRLLPTL
jgi:hypothetical protein